MEELRLTLLMTFDLAFRKERVVRLFSGLKRLRTVLKGRYGLEIYTPS